MTVSALSAARSLCELRDWNISNLQIQKILYITHMFYLGKFGEPLIRENFEAWDYGPVVPEVYSRARGFGSAPVQNVFHWVEPVKDGTPEYTYLRDAAIQTNGVAPGRLVAITHRDGGAWARNYRPGVRGIKIPNKDILEEYKALHVVA